MRLLLVEDDAKLARAARTRAARARATPSTSPPTATPRCCRRGVVRLRRHRPRRDAARARRLRRSAGRCASASCWAPVLMLTARDERRRPHPRARRRRRRLPGQAVRLRRAARAAARADPARGPRSGPVGLDGRRPRGRPRDARRSRAPASRSSSPPREFAVLEFLARHAGRGRSAARGLLDHVWDENYDGLDEHRRRLRRLPAAQARAAVRPAADPHGARRRLRAGAGVNAADPRPA